VGTPRRESSKLNVRQHATRGATGQTEFRISGEIFTNSPKRPNSRLAPLRDVADAGWTKGMGKRGGRRLGGSWDAPEGGRSARHPPSESGPAILWPGRPATRSRSLSPRTSRRRWNRPTSYDSLPPHGEIERGWRGFLSLRDPTGERSGHPIHFVRCPTSSLLEIHVAKKHHIPDSQARFAGHLVRRARTATQKIVITGRIVTTGPRSPRGFVQVRRDVSPQSKHHVHH
jgi:hypothetical protein